MSSSPQKPEVGVSFGPIKSRKRGLTKTLLGPKYEETVTSILEPPIPLTNLNEYTEERVLVGLRYADTALRHPLRKVSPGGEIALQLYKDSCVGLLDILQEDGEIPEIPEIPEDERRAIETAHRAFIRDAEGAMQLNECMRVTRTNKAQELKDHILELQRTTFYARYGDYFADLCNNLKVVAEAKKLAGWQTLSKSYWTDIARRVEIELPIYKKFLDGESGLQSQMPTTHAIQVASYSLGLDPSNTLHIVKQYSNRNELVHANLLPMIKGGKFQDLARRLHTDRMDLILLLPAAEKADRIIFEKLLDSIIDLWFIKNEKDSSNYQMWKPTKQLEDKYDELNASTGASETLINKKIAEDITQAVKINLQKALEEKGVLEKLTNLQLFTTGAKRPPKRVASSQLEMERKALKNDNRNGTPS